VRLPPFTIGSKLLQNGKFDISDRIFNSILDSYKSIIEEQSDVRELIPDIFVLPEMLLNVNRYDFGVMQSGTRVHNVQLPLWAENSAYKFV